MRLQRQDFTLSYLILYLLAKADKASFKIGHSLAYLIFNGTNVPAFISGIRIYFPSLESAISAAD